MASFGGSVAGDSHAVSESIGFEEDGVSLAPEFEAAPSLADAFWAGPAASFAASTAGGLPAGQVRELMCVICLVNPRGKKQVFCNVPCAGDVKAAERDALRRSGGNLKRSKGEKFVPDANSDIAIFRKLKKSGGEEFRNAILSYKVRCAGHGRGICRPSFDWVRYFMAIEMGSRMQAGTKCLWMSKHVFVKFLMQSDEYAGPS